MAAMIRGISPTIKSRDYKDAVKIAIPVLTPDRTEKRQNGRIRKLTPKECFRLQGFPDEYFERAAAVNSNTQLYKQ